MLRQLQRLVWRRHQRESYYCVLRFPDSTETRWLHRLPESGTRMLSKSRDVYVGDVWVVDEVLQSGRDTYTVFLTSRRQYLDRLRGGPGASGLATELLELARHAESTVADQRRRWKYRERRLR